MTVHVQSDYAQLPERRLEVQSLKNGMEALLGSGQNQPTGHQIQLISDMFCGDSQHGQPTEVSCS